MILTQKKYLIKSNVSIIKKTINTLKIKKKLSQTKSDIILNGETKDLFLLLHYFLNYVI